MAKYKFCIDYDCLLDRADECDCTFVYSSFIDAAKIKAKSVGTIIGYPSGGSMVDVKAYEASKSAEAGAKSIILYINYGNAYVGNTFEVESEIRKCKKALGKGKELIVAIKPDALDVTGIALVVKAAIRANADGVAIVNCKSKNYDEIVKFVKNKAGKSAITIYQMANSNNCFEKV